MSDLQDPNVATAPPVADFGTRFAAFMIDTALLVSVQWIVFIVLSRQLQAAGLTASSPCEINTDRMCEGPSDLLWAVLLVVLLVSTIGYYAFFDGRYGATPGKRWLGLNVVNADSSSPVPLGASVVRAVIKQAFWLSMFFLLDASPLAISVPSIVFLAIPVLCLSGVAYGAVAADGRSLHDLAAGTRVVRSDELADHPSDDPADDKGAIVDTAEIAEVEELS